MAKLRCVDLFSGCGGMSLGFEMAGFDVVAAYENWAPALRVYRANFDHPAVEQDLSNVAESVESITQFEPDLVIGGPPCQDFSTAGHQDETRGRAILSVKFSEIIADIRPSYFVMENVATIRNTESFRAALANFKKAGFGLTQTILDAAYCGVPQSRKRMFVVGGQKEDDGFLDAELERALSPEPMSIFNYLGDSLGIENYFRVPTNYNRRGVFSIYEPSMTIRAVDRPIPSGYKGHPNDSAPVSEVRGLTPKERSLIQTFPEEFEFLGGKSDQNSMIGNAVPVNLAKYVADALQRHIARGVANESD
ncbi:DNA cytosine methyltransferase [Mobiluncus curtisii]|uniref:DNA cytosine methyltransferase n=1 Tax=Mobiluncus curtisii TaxID=2051 RepID=UPI001917E2E7|nr:DNA cytosine methyltransferase [Mobiluncus curtisii]QQT13908.1 DNA cytosine methyltransferase [Mobiluncus curtisii]